MKTRGNSVLRKSLMGSVLAGICIAAVPSSNAYMALIYELDRRYAAGFPDEGIRMTATFIQANANTVELTLRADNIGSAYIQNWWFNFNGLPADLDVIGSTSTGGATPGGLALPGTPSNFNIGRDGIRWDFSFYSGASQDFQQGDTVTFALYSQSGLTIQHFDSYVNAGGVYAPNFYSGANIVDGSTTTKYLDFAPRYEELHGPPPFVLVPEASTVYLGFLMLVGAIGGEVFRRNRQPAVAPVKKA